MAIRGRADVARIQRQFQVVLGAGARAVGWPPPRGRRPGAVEIRYIPDGAVARGVLAGGSGSDRTRLRSSCLAERKFPLATAAMPVIMAPTAPATKTDGRTFSVARIRLTEVSQKLKPLTTRACRFEVLLGTAKTASPRAVNPVSHTRQLHCTPAAGRCLYRIVGPVRGPAASATTTVMAACPRTWAG